MRERKEEEDRPLPACQNYPPPPHPTLDTLFSLSIHSPLQTLLHTLPANLHLFSEPFLLFLAHLPPLLLLGQRYLAGLIVM